MFIFMVAGMTFVKTSKAASSVSVTNGGAGSVTVSGGGNGSVSIFNVTGSTNSGTVFVNDTFTDTNGTLLTSHTGETGATWTSHPSYSSGAGFQQIQTNRVVTSAAGPSAAAYASGVPPVADYDVNANVRALTNNFTNTLGITARMDTSSNTMVTFRYLTDNWSLIDIVGGTPTVIQSSTTALSTGADHSVQLSVVGNTATGSVDGIILCTGSTAISASGRVGIRGNSASTTAGIAVVDIQGVSR
jgi:hypothetical protein